MMSFKAVGYRQFYIHIVVLEALVSGVRCQVLKARVSLKPMVGEGLLMPDNVQK